MPGDVINYAITVANTGDVTLTGVVVTDPFADAGSIVRNAVDVVGDEDNLLEVGEIWGYTAAHTVTQAEMELERRRRRAAGEHGDGRQQRDRSGHRRRLGAGGPQPGALDREDRGVG